MRREKKITLKLLSKETSKYYVGRASKAIYYTFVLKESAEVLHLSILGGPWK